MLALGDTDINRAIPRSLNAVRSIGSFRRIGVIRCHVARDGIS